MLCTILKMVAHEGDGKLAYSQKGAISMYGVFLAQAGHRHCGWLRELGISEEDRV